jgi:hypothetical protein
MLSVQLDSERAQRLCPFSGTKVDNTASSASEAVAFAFERILVISVFVFFFHAFFCFFWGGFC